MTARHARLLPARNALMRLHAEVRGCKYIDAQAVCQETLAEDGIAAASPVRRNGTCAPLPHDDRVAMGKRCCTAERCAANARDRSCRPYGPAACFAHGCGAWHVYGDTLMRVVELVIGSECEASILGVGARGGAASSSSTTTISSDSRRARMVESAARLRVALKAANWTAANLCMHAGFDQAGPSAAPTSPHRTSGAVMLPTPVWRSESAEMRIV